MKNVKRILFMVIIFMFIFVTPMSLTLAAQTTNPGGSYGIDPNTYDPNNAKDPSVEENIISKYVSPMYGILIWVVVIVAVITLSIIGLKLITAGAQEKAEYKKHLVPVAVGILIAAFIFTILSVLAKFAGMF